MDSDIKFALLEPRIVSEVKTVADYLKERIPVIISIKKMNQTDARELIDFISGTIYVLDGRLENLSDGIFLLTPNNVILEGKLKDKNERID